jgi:hypothetical protein
VCHTAFDCYSDPGWVFFPSDLAYFIQFEEEDFERRVEAGRNGERVPRTCPTNATYKAHQAALVPADSCGGLYRRVTFRPFHSPFANLPTSAKVWHGTPLAAIQRAWLCLGSINADNMEEDFANLVKLRTLYLRADPPVIYQPSAPPSKIAQKKRGRGGSPGSEQPGRKRVTRSSGLLGGSSKEASTARSGDKPVGESSFAISSETENWVLGSSVWCLGGDNPPAVCQPRARPSKTARKKRGRGGSSKEASTARNGSKPVEESISPETENWILGPSVSCLDAIKRFAYLIESPSF